MHVRLNLIFGDPRLLDDAIRYVEDDGRTAVEAEPGNLGMSLEANSELGVAVVESFWVSGDAMRESSRAVEPIRKEAVRRAAGTVSVEHYWVASFTEVARPKPGAGVRLTRADTDIRDMDRAVAGYEDTAVPWLTSTAGFCRALLYVDRRSGRSINITVWRDPQALADSRSAAAAMRVDAVAATDSVIRAVEEYRLVFSSVLPT